MKTNNAKQIQDLKDRIATLERFRARLPTHANKERIEHLKSALKILEKK